MLAAVIDENGNAAGVWGFGRADEEFAGRIPRPF